ncbi:MAG TPA: GNAT family N-acetyltransferase, partial [Lachnospiraceae bacterium]|nr:GNAT family N-acetyltransferase [Lachnospiraceae bacterium]
MKTPVLESSRLILRPLRTQDAEDVFRNWASDPDVAQFMTWSKHTNVDITRNWLSEVEKIIDSDTIYDWGFVRKSDGVLIGCGGAYYKEERGMFSLGYNLMKSCWRHGYTTEAVSRIVAYLLKELNQTALFAFHAIDNPNSGKVMEKVGFRYVCDTAYDSMDGTRHFEAKEYL